MLYSFGLILNDIYLTYSLCLFYPLPDPANELYSLDMPYYSTLDREFILLNINL